MKSVRFRLPRTRPNFLLAGLLALLAACHARGDPPELSAETQAKVKALAAKSLTRLSYVAAGGFWLGDVGVLMNDRLKETGAVLGPDAKLQNNPGYTYGDDNKSPRWVTLDAFSMQQLKVTYADFDVYVQSNGLPKHPPEGDETYQSVWRKARTGDDVPAGVNWNQAKGYCTWIAKITGKPFDLPTEAQWEFAASNGRKTHWEPVPTDNGIKERGRNLPSYEQKKALLGPRGVLYPVGRFPPSKLKLSDLVGDGLEWVGDWYKADQYPSMAVTHNPAGPASGTERVLRGYPASETMDVAFPHTERYHELPVGEKLSGTPVAYNRESFRCVVNTAQQLPGTYVAGPGPVVKPAPNAKS